ncbi:oxidoreductase [Bacillus timonensis]|nr:oxidoreductase [Bacillus timonensis]
MEKKTALVIGATGLIGQHVVTYLLESPEYEKVTVWVRRPVPWTDSKLDVKVIDFEKMEEELFDFNDVFCCLGTTIKKAKSKETFKKVDLEYPLQVAKLAKESGSQQFLVVSAMGASASSKIFYNQVKGQLEEGLKKIEIPHLLIFRPSLLLGEREEFRFGEKVGEVFAKTLGFLMVGGLKKYRAIEGKQVAYAMVKKAANHHHQPVEVYESDRIQGVK